MDICNQLTEAQNRLELIEAQVQLEEANIEASGDKSTTSQSKKQLRTLSSNDDDKFFDCSSVSMQFNFYFI
jgi:hypothetical protein